MSSTLGLGRPHSGKSTKHPRQSSGNYTAVFDPAQLQTFKEAFNFFDQDSDGWITAQDLQSLLVSLGERSSPEKITALLNDKPAGKIDASTNAKAVHPEQDRVNFTMFVTMMAEHLSLLDPEQSLLDSFATFDPSGRGVIAPNELRRALKEEGDQMQDSEIDRLLAPPYLDQHGNFKYRLFCETLRVAEDPSER